MAIRLMGAAEYAQLKRFMHAALYGAQGTGKTLTALILAERLAQLEGKALFLADTEMGANFYAKAEPRRIAHPAAFDFQALPTRSVWEVIELIETYGDQIGALVLDSATHLWRTTTDSYNGKRMANDEIPVHAWGRIKKPWQRMQDLLLTAPFHTFMCGREGVVIQKDANDKTEVVGTKMKAEGEAGYEPDFLFRMSHHLEVGEVSRVQAFVEKDRTGVIKGLTFVDPTFEMIAPVIEIIRAGSGGAQPQLTNVAGDEWNKTIETEEEKRREVDTLAQQILQAIDESRDEAALRSAFSLTKGKKGALGDERYARIVAAKDEKKKKLSDKAALEVGQ